jgi:hypothetical protein
MKNGGNNRYATQPESYITVYSRLRIQLQTLELKKPRRSEINATPSGFEKRLYSDCYNPNALPELNF